MYDSVQPKSFGAPRHGFAGPLRRHRHRQRSGRRIARASPGADRQAHPAARARRLPAALARQLGRQGSVRRWRLPGAGDLVRQGRRDVPSRAALFRRRQLQDVRRGAVPPSGARFRRTPRTRTASHPPGRSATTCSSRTIARPRRCSMCTASAARIPNEPWSSEPYPYPPVSHEPRIQELNDKLRRPGAASVPSAARHPARRAGRQADADQPCIRCDAFDGFPCLLNGKADAQVICVDPALAAHPNVTLLTGAYVVEARDRRRRDAPSVACR